MFATREFTQLAYDVSNIYSASIKSRIGSSIFTRGDQNFKDLLNTLVVIEHRDFPSEKNRLRNDLENELIKHQPIERTYQLARLLVLAIDLVGCNELDKLNQILADLRAYLEAFLATEATRSYFSSDPSYTQSVQSITTALISAIDKQITFSNSPVEERLDHAKGCVAASKNVDTAVRNLIDASMAHLKQAGNPEVNNEDALVAQLNAHINSLEQARRTREEAEVNQTNLEKEIAVQKQKIEDLQAVLNSELDDERRANMLLVEENKVLKSKLDAFTEDRRKQFVFDIKTFKKITTDPKPLSLIVELLVLKRKIDLLHAQYSENRDKGQKYDLRACYIFFSKLLARLTDPEKQKIYLEDLKNPGYKDAEKFLCEQFLEHLIAIAERGAKELGVLGTQLKNQANNVEADPKVLKEFFAALDQNEAFIKQQTGLANEFYKVAERVYNNDFKLIIVEYGELILNNLPQFEILVDKELGLTNTQEPSASSTIPIFKK